MYSRYFGAARRSRNRRPAPAPVSDRRTRPRCRAAHLISSPTLISSDFLVGEPVDGGQYIVDAVRASVFEHVFNGGGFAPVEWWTSDRRGFTHGDQRVMLNAGRFGVVCPVLLWCVLRR